MKGVLVGLLLLSTYLLSCAGQGMGVELNFAGVVGAVDDPRLTTTSTVQTLDLQNGVPERVEFAPSDPNTILGILGRDPVYGQTLVPWISRLGLTNLFQASSITVFVPRSQSISALGLNPGYRYYEASENLVQTAELLKFFVVPGLYAPEKLTNGLLLRTQHGQPLRVTTNPLSVNGMTINPNVQMATNGLVYFVDGFLEPRDIFGVVEGLGSEFSIIANYLRTVVRTLPLNSQFTLFAPTNAAFRNLDPALALLLAKEPARLSATLLYHAAPQRILYSSFRNGTKIASAHQGQLLNVTVKDCGTFINGQRILSPNHFAYNGVVHTISGVIDLKNLVQVAEDFGATAWAGLVRRVTGYCGTCSICPTCNTCVPCRAGLNTTACNQTLKVCSDFELYSRVPRTVFAPLDTVPFPPAIAALLNPFNNTAIINALRYHVVPGSLVTTADMFDLQTLVTWYRRHLLTIGVTTEATGTAPACPNSSPVTTTRNVFRVNTASFGVTNLYTGSGILHLVNQFLVPRSISEILVQSRRFENLLAALATAGPISAPSLTVFAPVDRAFANVTISSVPLLNHVSLGVNSACTWVNGTTLTSLSSRPLVITRVGGQDPKVNGVAVSQLDHFATDGVVHFINSIIN